MRTPRPSVFIALYVALACTSVWVAFAWTERLGIRSLNEAAAQRLEIYRGGLVGEMRRYDYLSSVLSLNSELIGLLSRPDHRHAEKISAYLDIVARESDALDIYVMDLDGRTVAASNFRREDSFVGMNFSFRPYFKDALLTGQGHFYGVGTVSNEPGYYFASRIYDGQKLIGVATVKVALHSLENSLQDADEIALVIDSNGIIFLTSFPPLLFKSLEPLSPATMGELTATRQYHTLREFAAVGTLDRTHALDPPDTYRFRPNAAFARSKINALANEYLLLERPVAGTLWRLAMLSSLGPARDAARNAAATTGFAAIAIFLAALYWRQRVRTVAADRKAKLDLERAYDDLENQVQLRTEALFEANRHLQHEVAERRKTETALKDTFEELVHSGKMAALGQMATSMTHELNQPLAALQTLSDNAAVLLRRERIADARENLDQISQLVARMGRITGQLKSFARKAPFKPGPIDVRTIVEDTVSLLRVRLEHQRVATRIDCCANSTLASGDANRLEQVLVNLINNAVDAMRFSPSRRLTISVLRAGDKVRISVRDSGAGLRDEVASRLFEPFFTTKAAGEGLGLGLLISAGIVKEFGGTLAGRDVLDGAEFVIELPAVAVATHDA